jgi:divalent metal cation (Fe/Co/Zn/Cd) transporter
MDEANAETLQQTVKILRQHRADNWIDLHNLRIQRYGSDLHIDCHLTLPYYWDLSRVHEEVSAVSTLFTDNFNNSTEFFIHTDPCLPPDMCATCRVKNCPMRQQAFTQNVEWTTETLTRNQKHFEQQGT